MKMKQVYLLALVVHLAAPSMLLGSEDLTVTDLRCEYTVNPLGIDATKPHLSWKLESNTMGQNQTAYQVLVSSSPDLLGQDAGDLWDSNKIASGRSQLVAYSGRPLLSVMECHWKVRVWDKDGKPSAWSSPAKWAMGLLEPEDWHAKWIGAPATPVAPASKSELTVTKATYQTLDGSVAVDVTEIVKKELAKKKPFRVDFKALGGDPARNVVKELVVEYVRDGKPGIARASDFKTINLFGAETDSASPTPQFRKDFTLTAAPSSAWVTVNSPAYFELYVNGEKIGDDVLSPAVSKLDTRTFSLTYDVSGYLKEGENCIGLWLGIGWAESIVARAQLDAVVDGKPITIGTDTSWKTRTSSRYKIGRWKWGDFGGELVDARKALPDWCRPGLDTAAWNSAVVASDLNLGPVRNQPCPPNRLGDEIPPVSVITIGAGLHEVDFGTALTGWFRMKMPALEPGATVTMTFADAKSDREKTKLTKIGDSNWYQHFNQVSKFISAGKQGERFENKFNYAAFRYVIIEGLSSPPAEDSVRAMLVDSDLEAVGSFECSNALLNRIHEVNRRTQRCLDLGGYYVDCPHRERMGYGDGQVAAEGFMTNFRADGFYRKWLADWRCLQKPDGGLPNSAPFGKGGGGPGWGGLLSAIAWRHYLYYGDQRVLEENYDAIHGYVDYLEGISQNNGDILTGNTGKFSFIGDWVAPRRGMDSKDQPSHEARQVFNNCYRINQIEILIQMARALKKNDDVNHYGKLLETIRPKVHEAFYSAEEQEYVIDEQAYYVMPLMTGVVPDSIRPLMLEKLERNILEKNNGHLDTGMLGTYFMMEYLREIGRDDLVFTMFNQTTYPGWGSMLTEGTTTFWEQWNGYWSHVHSCFTSPDNWLYQGLAGIQADPEAPGFKNVIIKPAVVGDVTWVKAHHDSPYGRIVSNWTRENGKLTMEVTIPPNSTATIYVPVAVEHGENGLGEGATGVMVNGRVLAEAEYVTFSEMEKQIAVLEVESGTYVISSPQ
jgi:alpha-L-rhamnosidase